MSECPWKEIDSFQSPAEFVRFEAWLAEQIDAGDAEQIEVKHHYANSTTLRERWFRHKGSDKVWRLVEPDYPFAGIFEPV